MILNVQENVNDLSWELIEFVILEIKTICFLQMICIIQNDFGSFSYSLLLLCNLLVEIIRNRESRYFWDRICWDSPRLHGCNPIFDWKLSSLLLQNLFKLFLLLWVCVFVPIKFHLNNVSKASVLFKLSENSN